MRHAQRCASAAATALLLLGAIACAADRTTAPSLEPEGLAFMGDGTCPTGALSVTRGMMNLAEFEGDHDEPPPECNFIEGRMTGGGGQIIVGDVFISRGFTIHCDIVLSNNLEINWGSNNWHIDKPLDEATCFEDPQYLQPPPAAPFNTFIGEATGYLNGVYGSIVRFIFIDAGEPGSADKAEIYVWAPGVDPDVAGLAGAVLKVPLQLLKNGNIQAHYDQPHK